MNRRILISALLAILSQGPAVALPFSADSLSRKFDTFSAWCSPEKLYVHMDRTYYAADETIWFKGYLTNSTPLAKLAPGNFIYAEVLDKTGVVTVRVKVKRSGDGFPGYMYLPETVKTGEYTFRAYTLWQLNSSPEYMFNQRIRILGSEKAAVSEPPKPSDIDISFYPEGGRYFAGQTACIAVKALDADGRSVNASFTLMTDAGDEITVVNTSCDGMGRFNFLPVPGVRYYLQSADGRHFDLPAASTEGATVNIRQTHDKITVVVGGSSAGNCLLLARSSEFYATLASLQLDGRQKRLQLETTLFPPGINHLLLVDSEGRIMSERKFFVFDDREMRCSLTSGIRIPKPHGLITTDLSLTDAEGNPLDGSCSVSIVRGSFKNHQQDDGIISYWRLSSELKGRINNPYHYFDTSVDARTRANDMDLLMMVQGWSYYDYQDMVNPSPSKFRISHLKEYTQTVSGTISPAKAGKIPSNFIFSLIIPSHRITRFIDVKQAERFFIDSLDFAENTHFLISLSRPGIRRDYAPKWNGDSFAPSYSYFPAPGIAGKTAEQDRVPLVSEVVAVDTLSAAVLTADRSDAFDGVGVGHGVSADDFKFYKNYTLIEYLAVRAPTFEFDGENMYNRHAHGGGVSMISDEEEEASAIGTSSDMDSDVKNGAVKLLVDESEAVWWTYEYVKMEDIEALSISTLAESMYNAPFGLVAIRLKTGASLGDVQKRDSYIYFVPLGYQKPKAFYSPRYDKGDTRAEFDHRNTIYWSPETKVTGGKARIEFCNTDQMDYPYIVHIEGLSSDGKPFSGRSVLDFQEQSY